MQVDHMTQKIDPSLLQPYKLDPLEAGRAEPDFIVNLLEQFAGEKLSAEKKATLLTVISEMPEGSGMRDLYAAIKAQEAASLGVTAEQFEALSPVLEALRGILASGEHAAIFQQPDGAVLIEAVRIAGVTFACAKDGHARALARGAQDLPTRAAMVDRACRDLAIAARALADWAEATVASAEQRG